MSGFLEELLIYIEGQLGGSWVRGTNLFLYHFKRDVSPALMIYEEPGRPADINTDIYYPFLTILSKANDIYTASTNFNSLFTILNRLGNIELTSFQIVKIRSIGSAANMYIDDVGDKIFSASFTCVYKNIS